MKKIIALIFSLIFTLPLTACKASATLDTPTIYNVTSNVQSLRIEIGAADFTIEQAENFQVKSNLKYLSVSEKNGVLTIVDDAKPFYSYNDAMLTLYVPIGTIFETVNINTDAAKLTADTISSKSLDLQLGAGDVSIGNLNVTSEVEIDGGAGKITISDGVLNNLDLEMDVGELNLCAALLGESNLEFGVGSSNITLLGNRNDYTVKIEKGIGNITVDGEVVNDFSNIGNGVNRVEIEGGVGAINLKYQDN